MIARQVASAAWPYIRGGFAGAGVLLFIQAFTDAFLAPGTQYDPSGDQTLFVMGAVCGLTIVRLVHFAFNIRRTIAAEKDAPELPTAP